MHALASLDANTTGPGPSQGKKERTPLFLFKESIAALLLLTGSHDLCDQALERQRVLSKSANDLAQQAIETMKKMVDARGSDTAVRCELSRQAIDFYKQELNAREETAAAEKDVISKCSKERVPSWAQAEQIGEARIAIEREHIEFLESSHRLRQCE